MDYLSFTLSDGEFFAETKHFAPLWQSDSVPDSAYFQTSVSHRSMLLDGVVDEVVYQLDHTVTAVLPDPGISQEVPGPSKFMAHLFSGLVGAAVAVLAGQRRAQIQV